MGVTKGLAMQRCLALMAEEGNGVGQGPAGLEAITFDMVLCIGKRKQEREEDKWCSGTSAFCAT